MHDRQVTRYTLGRLCPAHLSSVIKSDTWPLQGLRGHFIDTPISKANSQNPSGGSEPSTPLSSPLWVRALNLSLRNLGMLVRVRCKRRPPHHVGNSCATRLLKKTKHQCMILAEYGPEPYCCGVMSWFASDTSGFSL